MDRFRRLFGTFMPVRNCTGVPEVRTERTQQSEQLGQFRLIGDRASDVSGGRICLTQKAYAEI